MRLPPGKIPIDILKEIVFNNLGASRKEVILGPTAGVDGAVINTDSKSIIVSMDPITGAVDKIGWLAVNVNANDVATFGVEPAFLFSCMLLPENAEETIVETIAKQMDSAAKELGIAIVGGHCESTPGLVNPAVVGCIMGLTEKGKYVTAAGAKPTNKLILTKSAGIEGTAILASDREQHLQGILTRKELADAKEFYKQISIVPDALTAYSTGGVNAMHDPTEGGISGGIHEIADASNLGVRIFEEKIPVKKETSKICTHFEINPLNLIASGALLIAADTEKADAITERLRRKGIQASLIGEFLPNPKERIIVKKNKTTQPLSKPSSDHLWAALAKQ
jgi:hydrogenase expression/formation protein HypE